MNLVESLGYNTPHHRANRELIVPLLDHRASIVTAAIPVSLRQPASPCPDSVPLRYGHGTVPPELSVQAFQA